MLWLEFVRVRRRGSKIVEVDALEPVSVIAS